MKFIKLNTIVWGYAETVIRQAYVRRADTLVLNSDEIAAIERLPKGDFYDRDFTRITMKGGKLYDVTDTPLEVHELIEKGGKE